MTVKIKIPHVCANCALWLRYRVLDTKNGECHHSPLGVTTHESHACGSWLMLTKKQQQERSIVLDLPYPDWQEVE